MLRWDPLHQSLLSHKHKVSSPCSEQKLLFWNSFWFPWKILLKSLQQPRITASVYSEDKIIKIFNHSVCIFWSKKFQSQRPYISEVKINFFFEIWRFFPVFSERGLEENFSFEFKFVSASVSHLTPFPSPSSQLFQRKFCFDAKRYNTSHWYA